MHLTFIPLRFMKAGDSTLAIKTFKKSLNQKSMLDSTND